MANYDVNCNTEDIQVIHKYRKENMDQQIKIKQKKEKELHLPKMLYSNIFIGTKLPTISLDNQEIRSKSFGNIRSEFIDNPIPFNNERYDKEYIEEMIKLNSQEEKLSNSHVGKPMLLFDDIYNCVDNLELSDKEKEEKEEKEEENKNNKINENYNEIKSNTIEQAVATYTESDIKNNSRNKR